MSLNDLVLANLGPTGEPDPVRAVWKPLEELSIGLSYAVDLIGQLLHLPALGAGKIYCHYATPPARVVGVAVP